MRREDVRIAGTACTYQGCFNAAIDPDTQANLQKEIRDLNEEVKKFQYYPIISLGLAYRFFDFLPFFSAFSFLASAFSIFGVSCSCATTLPSIALTRISSMPV